MGMGFKLYNSLKFTKFAFFSIFGIKKTLKLLKIILNASAKANNNFLIISYL